MTDFAKVSIVFEWKQQMMAEIIEKATTDMEFRSRLLDDPSTALEGEFGVTVPENLNIRVHEEDSNTAHVVLPRKSQLSEVEASSVSGGLTIGIW
ncbi:MAG: NHLP leader peptide family RiPP precursor [Rhodobacteraceae bacterium]|nr:NHLP leader peptide family RiPP precursor [Paracoccaceae bacterium]